MRSFLIALQFLTRIQVASRLNWSDVDFGRAVVWFPVVGLLIGLNGLGPRLDGDSFFSLFVSRPNRSLLVFSDRRSTFRRSDGRGRRYLFGSGSKAKS